MLAQTAPNSSSPKAVVPKAYPARSGAIGSYDRRGDQREIVEQHVLLEGRSIASGTVVNTDVCVIGAGAAGITLALSLANTALNVVVLESGGLDPSGEGQDQAKGEVIGLPYYPLESTRLRCFGGSTMHWGGWSRPFDAIDFEQRPWVPHSGWPITRETLDAYYLEAQDLCQLGYFDYAPAGWDLGSAVPLPLTGDAVATNVFMRTPSGWRLVCHHASPVTAVVMPQPTGPLH